MPSRFLNNININDEYSLPNADGSTGQIITTDGDGQLSFVDQSILNSGSAERTEILVKNLEGSSLSKGDPVYIIGSVGASERLEVGLADAGDSAKMPCVGLLTQDLAINVEGTAIVTGKLKNLITSPIDGATPAENDTIYVKPGGGLTLTKPTGVANLIQNVGQVGRVSTSNDGNIVVSAILRSNDVPNLTEGKIWVGSTGNTIESTVVHLDETNEFMGIGTNYPASKLVVAGDTPAALLTLKAENAGPNDAFMRFYNEGDGPSYSMGLDSSDEKFKIAYASDGNSLTSGTKLVMDTSGNVGIGTTSSGEKLEVNGNIKTTTVTITQGATVTYTGGGATYETLGTNVAFAREEYQGAMYNPLLNPGGWGYASRVQAPVGLLFNTDGWSNLTNIQERNYLNFVHALANNVGNNIINTELIMWDYLNDNYYKLKFTAWGQGGSGGYTYQRTPLTINNKRSIATDTISTNKITVGDKINMPSGIRLASNIDMASPAQDRWADLLVDPGQSTIKIVTDTALDNSKTTENYNLRIGHSVGKNTGTGVKNFETNVLIGAFVADSSTNTNTNSYYNVFIGQTAGRDLGQGSASYNVGIGQAALYNIQGGDYNTAIGRRAGSNVTEGSNNTFIGRDAGDNVNIGSNNTGLGYGADPSSSSVSNTITLGNSSITALRCQVTSITSLSDKRDKTNIEPSTYGLNVINKLNPVTFDWNMRDEGKVGDKDLGFIAQDLQEVDDENLKLVYDDNPEKLEASYGRLIPVMTKAIQELSTKIEMLESKIQTLENK